MSTVTKSPKSTTPTDTPEKPRATITGMTRNDRFGVIAVFLATVGAVLLGLALREGTLNQQWQYNSRVAGIEASYPSGWLVDEGGDYVARISDPKARPFKTQYIINVVPAGGEASVRNVLDNLTLQRSADLAAYRVLSVEDVTVGGVPRTEMRFAFVDSDPNPFIQRLPVVVLGLDVIILDDDRAIVVTFMAEETEFPRILDDFERFLASMRY